MTSGINNLVLNKKATQQRIQLRRKFAFLALDLTLEIWDSVMCLEDFRDGVSSGVCAAVR